MLYHLLIFVSVAMGLFSLLFTCLYGYIGMTYMKKWPLFSLDFLRKFGIMG